MNYAPGLISIVLIQVPFMAGKLRAFTLVETLVVISIIALLVALLLPVLGSARRSVRYTVCAANVHSFGQAWTGYHQDHDGRLVYPNWGESSPGWLYADPNGSGWRSPRSYATGEQRGKMRETGHLFEYLNRENEIYHCPEDDGPFDDISVPARDLSSYQFNGAASGYGRLRIGETYTIEEFNGNCVIMWETDERRSGGVWNDGGNRPDEGISERHIDGAPVARMDGSAEEINYDEFYRLVNDRNGPNELWCSPATVIGH